MTCKVLRYASNYLVFVIEIFFSVKKIGQCMSEKNHLGDLGIQSWCFLYISCLKTVAPVTCIFLLVTQSVIIPWIRHVQNLTLVDRSVDFLKSIVD